jgi:hypothetical protein
VKSTVTHSSLMSVDGSLYPLLITILYSLIYHINCSQSKLQVLYPILYPIFESDYLYFERLAYSLSSENFRCRFFAVLKILYRFSSC